MTHQSSLSTCKNSCIPTRVACITDSRCYHPRHGELELNIQLPDVKIPPCPPCPPCPSYPQPEPEPKTKEPLDLSKLPTRVNILNDDIVDARTGEPTGLKSKECAKIIMETKNDLEIKDGKLVGSCDDNAGCDECVKAINSSVIEIEKEHEVEPFMSTLEGTVYIL